MGLHIKSKTNKKRHTAYSYLFVHGGILTDMLQTMTLRQLFDCNGKIYKELPLNITNKMMLVAMTNDSNQIDADSLLWIGNKIQLNEFIDLPNLFGHKLTKIGGNKLVITGGISNECGNIAYSETFSFVIPCIDEIIQNAMNGYLDMLSTKYSKATNSKTYQKHNVSPKKQQNNQHKKQQHQSHSNQRYKKNNKNKKSKQQKNKQKGKKSKGSKQQKNNKHKQPHNDQLLVRQNNMRSNNVYKDVMKSSCNEAIKLNTNSVANEEKWNMDIAMCSFCFVIELYSTQNKWLRLRNNNGLFRFCSRKCQNSFKQQQQIMQKQLKQYRQQQMQYKLQQQHAAE